MIKINDKSENIDTLYNQLTNVDIQEQKRIWDERGKGYYGEFITFEELYDNIIGEFKILMNLNIPKENGSNETTEIDLIMIHETGIYVFECKHYKGTIYGNSNDKTWTQFFKTQSNEHFYNPILQNKGHIQAIKNICPDVNIFSCIIFTQTNCVLKVQNNETNTCVCNLYEITRIINNNIKRLPKTIDIDKINNIFNTLLPFSSMKETVKSDSGNEKEFVQWLVPVINSVKETKSTYETKLKQVVRMKKAIIIVSSIIIVLCLTFSLLFCYTQYSIYKQDLKAKKDAYEQSLQEEVKRFEEFKENYIYSTNDDITNNNNMNNYDNNITNKENVNCHSIYKVSNVSIYTPTNQNYVKFSARLTAISTKYGFRLTETSKYIVTTLNGNVYTYDVFGKNLIYNQQANTLAGNNASGNLKTINFENISTKEEIVHIKLSDIECFKLDSKEIIQNFEIELYKIK